ncbi:MAG TPA: hypothetical protein VNB59_02720 [Solirubrobacterales bacterium]|jgi:hypothetical protein|nr:hypothetical protein [Solirubrobacterales bacterium]
MFTWGRRVATPALLLVASALGGASPSSAATFGSTLTDSPNAGICAVPAGATEASCTYSQLLLADGDAAAGGAQLRDEGVITSFRVSSGPLPPGTASVKLRLRLLDPSHGYAFTAGLPFVEMPLGPGIHEFPVSLQFEQPMQVGLDTIVTRVPGEASAPLAHAEAGVGSVYAWIPSPPEVSIPPPASEENRELLFNVTVEPDRDHDGYGDKTQDRCPEDSRRQAHCDRRPPRAKLTYPPHQAFLVTTKVVVRLRSSETGSVRATGQIEIGRDSVWGIYSAEKNLGKGEKRTLVLRVPAKARAAALHAMAHGQRVIAKVFASATDRFGNESGITVATVMPKR